MKLKIKCNWCGIEFEREECYTKGKKHLFCSRQCLADFSNKKKNPKGYATLKNFTNISSHMTKLNEELNPTRMNKETRKKLRRVHLGKGKCDGYSKIYGKSAHRVIAEQMLGRKLKPNEVVHHRDHNKYNNEPNNLVIFSSAAEHAKFHSEFRWFLKELERLDKENESE